MNTKKLAMIALALVTSNLQYGFEPLAELGKIDPQQAADSALKALGVNIGRFEKSVQNVQKHSKRAVKHVGMIESRINRKNGPMDTVKKLKMQIDSLNKSVHAVVPDISLEIVLKSLVDPTATTGYADKLAPIQKDFDAIAQTVNQAQYANTTILAATIALNLSRVFYWAASAQKATGTLGSFFLTNQAEMGLRKASESLKSVQTSINQFTDLQGTLFKSSKLDLSSGLLNNFAKLSAVQGTFDQTETILKLQIKKIKSNTRELNKELNQLKTAALKPKDRIAKSVKKGQPLQAINTAKNEAKSYVMDVKQSMRKVLRRSIKIVNNLREISRASAAAINSFNTSFGAELLNPKGAMVLKNIEMNLRSTRDALSQVRSSLK